MPTSTRKAGEAIPANDDPRAKPSAWREEFIAAGYRPYRDSFMDRDEGHVPAAERMYVGSMQRRFRDARGTRYFISVNLYDFTRHGGRRSAAVTAQFHAGDGMNGQCWNVETTVLGDVASVETLIHDLWSRMGWGYYEVDDRGVPPANARAEAPSPVTGGA